MASGITSGRDVPGWVRAPGSFSIETEKRLGRLSEDLDGYALAAASPGVLLHATYREEMGIPVDSFGEFQGRQRLIPSGISHVGLRDELKFALTKDELWKAVGNVGKPSRNLVIGAIGESVTGLPPLPEREARA